MPDKTIIPSNALHQAGMFLIEMTAQGTVIITGKEGMKIEPCGNNSIMLTPCARYVPSRKMPSFEGTSLARKPGREI